MVQMNEVKVTGNLTADPTVSKTASDTQVCNFSIAHNENYKSNGETKSRVSFINVSAFGNTVDFIAKYLTKGSPVLVEGKLNQDTWQDKDGNARSQIKIIATRVQALASKKREEVSDPSEDVTAPF